MSVLSKMTAVELPDDIIDTVFDYLDNKQIILASHVCQRWRRAARNHRTFRGEASLTRTMNKPAIDYFFARREQAQLASGLISVTVWPSGGLQEDPARMSLMQNRIVPALSADMARLTALHIEVPFALEYHIFNALCQPAPALRSFTITNWDHRRGSWIAIPHNIFATQAPQLDVLRIGDGVTLQAWPIPGFRTVKSVGFLPGCYVLGLHRLSVLLQWFPELRKINALATPIDFVPNEVLRLTESELERLRQFASFSLDMGVYQAVRQLGDGRNFVAASRNVDLCGWSVIPRHFDMTDMEIPGLVASLIPQSHRSAVCSMNIWATEIHFEDSRGTSFVRKFPSGVGANVDRLIWTTLCSSASIVTLYIDEGTLASFLRAEILLPALETLYINMCVHLPCRQFATGAASCPRLRSVILGFENTDHYDSPSAPGFYLTCRGVDRFLSGCLSVKTWADIEVTLVGFLLFGPASAPGTHITGVSVCSRHEFYNRNPQLAALIRNAPSLMSYTSSARRQD